MVRQSPRQHPLLAIGKLRSAYAAAPALKLDATSVLDALGIDIDKLPLGAKAVSVRLSRSADVNPFTEDGTLIPSFSAGDPNAIAVPLDNDMVLVFVDGNEAVDLRWTIPEPLVHLREIAPAHKRYPKPTIHLASKTPYPGISEARTAARDLKRQPGGSRAYGCGIVFEVESDSIVGVNAVEHSMVLNVESDIDIDVGSTTRRGLRLVEWYGTGPAPEHASRWPADIFVTDSQTRDFVMQAIEEKLARLTVGYTMAA